ncbi:MAG: DUF1667 domain-containing protein [Firmicutes bacterium]|nr:DUF1667 domain-containing protein [Bacillota bacterium]
MAEKLKEKEMICILCPLGCKMQVSEKEGEPGELLMRGQLCKKGKEYAYEEFTNPTRTLTSTVVVHGAVLPRLPVKTSKPIPIKMIFPVVEEIAKVEIKGPVKMGDVIISDVLGSGIDIVATRSLR